MKSLLKRILRGCGFQLRRTSADPIVRHMDEARDILRLSPNDPLLRQHTLERLALLSKLSHLLGLHDPDLVVDVGANRGQFADQLRSVGYTGKIISIEPQASLAASLRARAASEGSDWEIIHGSAGEIEGRMTLHTFTDDTFSSLHLPNKTAHENFGALPTQTAPESVTVRRLDSWLAEHNAISARRIFLKTDTQGHDLSVLRGAPRTLSRSVIVMAEGSFVPLYDTIFTPSSLADFLIPQGFKNAGNYSSAHEGSDFSALEADCVFTRAATYPLTTRHDQPARQATAADSGRESPSPVMNESLTAK
jgi:FkbM family methyltransferase